MTIHVTIDVTGNDRTGDVCLQETVTDNKTQRGSHAHSEDIREERTKVCVQ